jgi:hypothetical protein
MRVSAVTDLTVQGLVNSVAKLSAGQAGKCLEILRRAIGRLVPHVIPRNPCHGLKKPRVIRKEIHPLTQVQAERLIEVYSGDRLAAIYVVAILSGARLGELLALSWPDVDFAAGAISIRRTLTNAWEINPTEQTAMNCPKCPTTSKMTSGLTLWGKVIFGICVLGTIGFIAIPPIAIVMAVADVVYFFRSPHRYHKCETCGFTYSEASAKRELKRIRKQQ